MTYRRQPDGPDVPPPPAPPRRRRRGLGVVPTLFTLGNALCGFASLHFTARGYSSPGPESLSNYAVAGYLIFAAMLFDMFDGFMARLTKSTSDFGAELDSLADMVSFGIAPAFLALKVIGDLVSRTYPTTLPGGHAPYEFLGPVATDPLGKLFWLIGALYVCCTALRLARFNVITEHNVESHMNFRGLPSPGAAGVVTSSILFFEALNASRHILWTSVPSHLANLLNLVFPYLLPIVLLVAALLMVSRFAYAHLINRFLRGRRRFNYVVRIVLILMLAWWQPQITALLGIYLYALSAPALWLWRIILRRPPADGAMASARRPANSPRPQP